MYVLLVCVWCSLDAGGLLMVVTAQPTVSAEILTPEADRKVGGQVDMRSTATNITLYQIVEWRSTFLNSTLRWNDTTIITNRGFMFTSTYPQPGMVVQDFTITDLQIDDYDEYVCNVRAILPQGGSTVVVSSKVVLSLPSYPICSPSGPITVYAETELPLRCVSEAGIPAVIIAIYPSTDFGRYMWGSSRSGDLVTSLLELVVDDDNDDFTFLCTVSTGVRGSCFIGPVHVLPVTSLNTQTTPQSMPQFTPRFALTSQILIAAFILLICVFLISIGICVFRVIHHRRTNKLLLGDLVSRDPETKSKFGRRLRSAEASETLEAHPNKALRPTEDRMRVDMEPTTATTNTNYEPIEMRNESPKHRSEKDNISKLDRGRLSIYEDNVKGPIF